MKYLIGLGLVFMLTAYSQQRYLVTPANEAIPLKSGESAEELIKKFNANLDQIISGYQPDLFPAQVEFPAYHRMIVGTWFTAPSKGAIDTIFWMGGSSNGAIESLVIVAVYQSYINPNHGPGDGAYPEPCTPWGYFLNIWDNDQGIAPFPEWASDTAWYSTLPGTQKSFPPFGLEKWGQGGGYAQIQRQGVNKMWCGINDLPCSVSVGESFFIPIRLPFGTSHTPWPETPTTFTANVSNVSQPSHNWVFYEHSGEDPTGLRMPCGGAEVPPYGWTARGGPTGQNDGMEFNIWYLMTACSDVPPIVVQYDKLGHTFSTAARTVTAEIVDSNPVQPEKAGIASVYLIYSINNNQQDSVPMVKSVGDVWSAILPGESPGTEVCYHISATDSNGNRNTDKYDRYRVCTLPFTHYLIDTSALYSWIEIDTSGTKLSNWFRPPEVPPRCYEPSTYFPLEDVGTSGPIDIGGSFKFFNSEMKYVWIGVDGALCLSSSSTDTVHVLQMGDVYPPIDVKIPSNLSRNFIAPMFKNFALHGDYTPDGHGSVYYKQDGNRFIIEWDSVSSILDKTDSTTTFEVILDRTENSMTFQYKDVGKYLSCGYSLIGLQAEPSEKWLFLNGNGGPPETQPRNGKAMKLYSNNTYPANNGWGMYSFPAKLVDPLIHHVFPNAISDAFEYINRSYMAQDTIKEGTGYWLKVSGDHINVIWGPQVLIDTFQVVEGWNMIGSISVPIPTSSITSDPPGITTSNFFGYSTIYFISDTIYPSKAYWVKVSQPGSLILSSTPPLQTSARIRIIPTSDLPPSPPDEKKEIDEIPKEFSLSEAYPNPFNPSTVIRYQLPVNMWVTFKIYNLLGQEVATLVDEFQDAGYKSVEWQPHDVASGIFFYKLSTERFVQVRKMLLIQ
jgi:hypothetical protein